MKLQELIKMEKKIQKIYFIYCNLLIAQKFMTSSLSNLVNKLFEGIHRIKCKFGHNNKKSETCGIKYKYCERFLEYTNLKII